MSMIRRVLLWVRKKGIQIGLHEGFDSSTERIIRDVMPYTMTDPERIAALITATRYLVDAGVPGAFVECGVWRGGSMRAVARTLLAMRATDRDLYLFDTFEGMPDPGAEDISYRGRHATRSLRRGSLAQGKAAVERTMTLTGYPEEAIHLVPGKVEDTIPEYAPERIALLRLDTDYYSSTKHELTHLFPRLATRGVLIIDDYGHWHGARQAVDEYIGENGLALLLTRVDYTCRLAVKA